MDLSTTRGPSPTGLRPRLAVLMTAIGGLTAAVLGLTVSGAGAHSGPVDGNNGHFCQPAEAQNNLCTPAGSYHTHSAQGNMILGTPPPGASPVTAAGVATPPPAVVPATAPAPQPVNQAVAAAPPPAQMARTGRASRELATGGLLVAIVGGLLLFGTRAVPIPALLELDRPRSVPPR